MLLEDPDQRQLFASETNRIDRQQALKVCDPLPLTTRFEAAESLQQPRLRGQFWTPIPLLRGSKLRVE
jgi:hypothetical protein